MRATGLGALGAGVTGCLHGGSSQTNSDDQSGDSTEDEDNGSDGNSPTSLPSVLEDRPDAVYYPTHTDGMDTISHRTVGDYGISIMYSYPHRFWTTTGTRTNRVDIRPETDDIHFMASVWDGETDTPIPASLTATFKKDGEQVAESNLWTMLSQQMGFHNGDNMDIGGDGVYEVDLSVSPGGFERRRGFEGRFKEPVKATFEFDYSESRRDLIFFEIYDNAGERRAVEPMMERGMDRDMGGMGGMQLFFADDPGEDGVVGDLRYDVSLHELDGETYLAVVAWTPYNEFVVPYTTLSTEVNGQSITLDESIDPEIGHHYGAFVDAEEGDEVTVSMDTPPQVARHEGYETAFMETGSFDVTL